MALLSICIPTYNRLEQIKRQVEFFIFEGVLEKDIELIVSNNCSTDGTTEYLERINEKYNGKLMVINQKTNLGSTGNAEKCIEIASGEYVWLVGDDDYLFPNIINMILNLIEMHNEVAWIFLKSNCRRGNEILDLHTLDSVKGYYKNGFELFKEILKCTKDVGSLMFSTANIYRNAHLKKAYAMYISSNEAYSKSGNMALPLGLTISIALTGDGVITDEVCLSDNVTDISWESSQIQVFFRDELAMLDTMVTLMGMKLSKLIDVRHFIQKYPEFQYMRIYFTRGPHADNYAMKYWLRNNPLVILIDFFGFLGHVIKRCFENMKERIKTIR